MEFISQELDDYVCGHTEKEPELLSDLNRTTHMNVLVPRMLSGHFQGRVLSMISHMIKPTNVLEIGTYTGYSALCFAEGLAEDGKILTLDKNEELEDMVNEYIDKSDFKGRITVQIGDAIEIIPTLDEKFDLVFIDADKSNYTNYFHLIIDKMNSGGIILSDNVLWSGKVVEELDPKDKDTKVLLAYNRLMNEDIRIETILLPIRDGLTISRVK